MDMIHGPDQDLFTWDDEDDRVFLEVLTTDQHRLTWYPQDWIKFIEEIPLKNWLQINNMTRIDNRLERDSTDVDTYSRVATVMLKYLPAPVAREKILTTLGIELEDYGIAFDTMARAVDRDHQNWSALANNLATNTYPLMRGSPSYGFRGYEEFSKIIAMTYRFWSAK
ncbi:hypothetical protein B0H14DRAFT_3432918 [Mycena olivaceomarginata]|nr:hypothetical protein B0H14DRAFT_3432918 [Mycena olivaceomarginata]